jgi:hypothetical protein
MYAKGRGRHCSGSKHPRAKLITFRGETKTLSEWSEKTGIHLRTLSNRINRGWTVERALTRG